MERRGDTSLLLHVKPSLIGLPVSLQPTSGSSQRSSTSVPDPHDHSPPESSRANRLKLKRPLVEPKPSS